MTGFVTIIANDGSSGISWGLVISWIDIFFSRVLSLVLVVVLAGWGSLLVVISVFRRVASSI